MNMNEGIYCGKGSHIPYADFMDFIDMVFGFTTPEQKFEGLLPKLYREDRRPQDQNYVVTEEGKLMAAVGAYDHEITVCGIKIPCRGVGNVAVHPEARSKGYMKATMNAALEDMIRDGIALSTLGGRRQRYQYFSYDKAGPCYTYSVARDNIRHVYGSLDAPFTLKEIVDANDPLIDGIMAIAATAAYVPTRAREAYLDIAKTWKCRLLAFMDGERLAGYCIADQGTTVIEIRAARDEDFMALIRSFSAFVQNSISVGLSAFDASYIRDIDPVAEHVSYSASMSYSVLCYRLILEAFMKLKMTYATVSEGKLVLNIHGYAGDERLCLSVKGGECKVETVSDDVQEDLELDHLEALNILFAPISPERERMNDLIRNWFPLPLWMYRSDEV